jgi:uncharacterized membrane protein
MWPAQKESFVMTFDWRPLLCGLFFGIYPILANRSKLSSGVMLLILGLVIPLFALVLFLQNGVASYKAATISQLGLMVVSGCLSALGLIFMFRYLASTPTEKAGGLVIVMVVTQVVITWLTSLFFARSLPSGRQVVGVVCAAITIYLLQA